MSLALAQAAAQTTDNSGFLWWGLVLFGAALFLLFLELLVPSGGLIGLLCGVAAIASVVAFFRYDFKVGMAAAVLYAFLTPVLLVFVFKLWVHSPLARRMILADKDEPIAQPDEETVRESERVRSQRLAELRQLIGAEGMTVSDLRPVGFVTINGRRMDGLAESGTIDAQTPIVVTDVYDNQVKVRAK